MAKKKKNVQPEKSGGCLVNLLKLAFVAVILLIASVMIFVFSYGEMPDGEAPGVTDAAMIGLLLYPKVSLIKKAEIDDLDTLILSQNSVNSLLRLGLRGKEMFSSQLRSAGDAKYDATFNDGHFDFYYSHPVWAGHIWLHFFGRAKVEIKEHKLDITIEHAKLGKVPVPLKWAERQINEKLTEILAKNSTAADVLALLKEVGTNENGAIVAIYYPARGRKFLRYLDVFQLNK